MVVLASRSEILEYFLHHWILLTLSTRQKDESHLQPVGLSQAEVEVEMSCLSLVKCLRFLWNMEQWCIWLKPLDLRQEWKRSGDSSNLSGGERVGIPPEKELTLLLMRQIHLPFPVRPPDLYCSVRRTMDE